MPESQIAEPLLPSGYTDFELGLRDEYEDDYIKAIRSKDGSVQMTCKPLKDVFIYEESK